MKYFKRLEDVQHVIKQLQHKSGEVYIVVNKKSEKSAVLDDIFALLLGTPYSEQVTRHKASIRIQAVNGINGMRIKAATSKEAQILHEDQLVTTEKQVL